MDKAMKKYMSDIKYIPGYYAKSRPGVTEIAERYIREWEERRLEAKKTKPKDGLRPSICFSRKIGVGALEIADILSEKTGYRVVDRELIEYIANEANLSEKTVKIFDEKYPGLINELLSYAFGEKAFIKSDYTRHLFKGIFAMAGFGPTIFVGRGVHLALPRERVLAVRLICSKEYRIQRLARMLEAKDKDVEKKLDQVDSEQREFFKRVYNRKDASPYEFDLVINCDYIEEPDAAAEIIAVAFEKKFGRLESA